MSTTYGLTQDGCLARQRRLRAVLRDRELDAALVADPRHVHYLSGHHDRGVFHALLLVPAADDGPATLALPYEPPVAPACDRVVLFPSMTFGTLVDDQPAAALDALAAELSGRQRVACDHDPRPGRLASHTRSDLNPILRAMRRHKDADELTLIRRAVSACEAAYARAREILRPGLAEIEFYAELLAAAVKAAGEPVGEFGNDFQSGAPGGPPRNRPVQAGELMILDLSVSVRGYRADLCRTFAVGGEPTAAQRHAHARVLAALARVEQTAKAGTICRALDADVRAMLDGHSGCRFPHHLGHGTGLSPHEAPRLNPRSNDVLEVGDVIAIEPGLYGPELKAGVRVEQNYVVTESRLERLSSFPTDL